MLAEHHVTTGNAANIESAERVMREAKDLEAGPSAAARAIIGRYIRRIDLAEDALDIHLIVESGKETPPIITARINKLRRGNDAQLILHAQPPIARDVQLAQLIADAHAAKHLAISKPKDSVEDLARRFDRSTARFKRLLRLSDLAPDIVQAILAGT